MADKLCLLVCESLEREAAGVIQSEGFDDVMVATFPVDHCNGQVGADLLRGSVPVDGVVRADVDVACGACCSDIDDYPEELGRWRPHLLDGCCRLFLDGNLDLLRLSLVRTILEWRLENERSRAAAAVANANRQSASYAMVADLIADLTRIMTEAEAVEAIFEVFTMLFAPAKMVYVPIVDGRPGNARLRPTSTTLAEGALHRLARLGEDYAWTESGKGFTLRISRAGETLGVLEIDGIAFPEYKEHYLNLALTVGKVCALAASNARTYEQIKRMESMLEAERNRLAVTLYSIGDGVIATDTQGRVLMINHVSERLVGWTQEEAVGRPLEEIFHIVNARTRQLCDNPVEKVLSTGAVVGLANDTALIARDGSERIIEDSAAPILDQDGNILGAILVFRDATERRRAQAERERLLVELERRATELAAANQELEAFAYSVSHDLKAPLRTVDGFSQMLLEDYADRLDDQGKEYVHIVRQGSQRMAQLIDDLLSLSRINRSEMIRQQVDLSELAQRAAIDLKRSQPERRVEFAIAPGLLVDGDARLLRVALENLLGNAWKFTSHHRTATIQLGKEDRQGQAVYYIRDDGAGFDPAFAGKLFSAFKRLHNDDEFPGNGIGLATVQRIIHRHGGQIWAEGAVERGATFYFTIPTIP